MPEANLHKTLPVKKILILLLKPPIICILLVSHPCVHLTDTLLKQFLLESNILPIILILLYPFFSFFFQEQKKDRTFLIQFNIHKPAHAKDAPHATITDSSLFVFCKGKNLNRGNPLKSLELIVFFPMIELIQIFDQFHTIRIP